MNIQHSSRTDRWFTPEWLMEMVKTVLGEIDLDPASESEANKVIGAKQIITKDQDGLSTAWNNGSLFLNPPGGKLGNKSMAFLFWRKLMMHRRNNPDFSHAIFMGFSVEQLAICQNFTGSMLDFPICVPKKRIQFVDPTSPLKKAPSHANVIVYVPGNTDKTELFIYTFRSLGVCKR